MKRGRRRVELDPKGAAELPAPLTAPQVRSGRAGRRDERRGGQGRQFLSRPGGSTFWPSSGGAFPQG